jgi:hypothetical protein
MDSLNLSIWTGVLSAGLIIGVVLGRNLFHITMLIQKWITALEGQSGDPRNTTMLSNRANMIDGYLTAIEKLASAIEKHAAAIDEHGAATVAAAVENNATFQMANSVKLVKRPIA